MPEKMQAARLHTPGQPFEIESVPVPQPRADEVLIQVAAAGLIPNMRAVVSGKEWYALPPLPAVYGLDAAGNVVATGTAVTDFAPGDRVYVNPVMSCGSCPSCRRGDPLLCDSMSLRGYFSTGPKGEEMQRRYPTGAFAEYLTAPTSSLVKLSDAVTFAQAARFGYLGTSYHALKAAGVSPGTTVVISGVTGTLGVAAVQLARAMGADRVVGLGRNPEVLDEVKALDPERIAVINTTEGDLESRLREAVGDGGADSVLDCQGRGAAVETTEAAVMSLRKGGRGVVIGAVEGAMRVGYVHLLLSGITVTGTVWFTTEEGNEMVAMATAGNLDLSVWQTHAFQLTAINEGLQTAASRLGGFVNVIVTPSADITVD